MIEPSHIDPAQPLSFDMLPPPKRHDIEYVAKRGEPVFMRWTHAILPAPLTDIINSASTEDFQELMRQQNERQMVGILDRYGRPCTDR